MGAVGGGLFDGKRGWRRYERNRRTYERFRKNEVELFLKKARDVVWSIDQPWEAKPGGKPAYNARGMVLCSLLRVKMWRWIIEASHPTLKPTQTY